MTEHAAQGGEAVRLEITSETTHLVMLRAAVSEAARKVGLPEREAGHVTLALDEAVTNIIRHGYAGEPGRPIELEISHCRIGGRPALQLVLQDRGRQVDPGEIVGRDLQDIRPGGLGTHIIRSMMDEVEYSHRESGGMQVRMVKYLSGRTHCHAADSHERKPPDAG